jgi:hypothetical protein
MLRINAVDVDGGHKPGMVGGFKVTADGPGSCCGRARTEYYNVASGGLEDSLVACHRLALLKTEVRLHRVSPLTCVLRSTTQSSQRTATSLTSRNSHTR